MSARTTADPDHYRKLERMYHSAPASSYFDPTLRVEEARAEVTIPIRDAFLHSAGAVHGSVCFKALDDTGRAVARGKGAFARSRLALWPGVGYGEPA